MRLERYRVPTPLRGPVVLLLWLLGSVVGSPVHAEVPIVEEDSFYWGMGGYTRMLSGFQRIGYDTYDLFDDETALNASIVRFEWGMDIGDDVTLEIHDRFYFNVTSTGESMLGGSLGLGATTAPERLLDMQWTITEGDGFLLEHDLDRAVLHWYFDFGDLHVGRQAVTWGNATLFPVADLWTQFSPFELDTSQKRGVDGVRFFAAVSNDVELDFIIAEKSEPEIAGQESDAVDRLAGGVRASFYLDFGDVYVATAKVWNEITLLAGISGDLERFTLRLDALGAFHLDDEEVQIPRVTAGLDYYAEDFFLSLELHLNGLGVSDSDEYLMHFADESLARGESYLLGRYYAGAMAVYNVTDLVALNLTTMTNLVDPSAIFSAGATYQVSEGADLAIGAYVPVGASPGLDLSPWELLLSGPEINSEFGTYGQMFYAQMAAYW